MYMQFAVGHSMAAEEFNYWYSLSEQILYGARQNLNYQKTTPRGLVILTYSVLLSTIKGI